MKIFLLFNSSLSLYFPTFCSENCSKSEQLPRYDLIAVKSKRCLPFWACPELAGWLAGRCLALCFDCFIYYCRIDSKDWICCILAVRVCLSQIPFCLSNAAVFKLKETSLNLGLHTPWSSLACNSLVCPVGNLPSLHAVQDPTTSSPSLQ